MRHPMIAALLGLAAEAVNVLHLKRSIGGGLGNRSRGREGSCVRNPSAEHQPHRQSDKSTDVHLRGHAGAKMARKAKAKTLGLRHGTSAYMKWGKA